MLTLLSEDGYRIRRVTVRDAVHFVAKDLAEPLGLSTRRMRQKWSELDDDEKGGSKITTLGGEQIINTVTEPGLISLILSCPKSRQRGTVAWRYRRWVTHEVLPELHRTGRFEINRLTRQIEYLENNRLFNVAWGILQNTKDNYDKVIRLRERYSHMFKWIEGERAPFIRSRFYEDVVRLLQELKEPRYAFLTDSDSEEGR